MKPSPSGRSVRCAFQPAAIAAKPELRPREVAPPAPAKGLPAESAVWSGRLIKLETEVGDGFADCRALSSEHNSASTSKLKNELLAPR